MHVGNDLTSSHNFMMNVGNCHMRVQRKFSLETDSQRYVQIKDNLTHVEYTMNSIKF
jgi:hypothetical protein